MTHPLIDGMIHSKQVQLLVLYKFEFKALPLTRCANSLIAPFRCGICLRRILI